MNPEGAEAGGSVFAAAVAWLQGTLLGSVATAAAVIAVASVGFLWMSGRIDVRRAAQVILGCFILFGASSIAEGIVAVAGGDGDVSVQTPAPPLAYVAPPPPTAVKALPYDPYAGAALPTRR
jgi:type IV secretory pathway VirB2 component (pilin)